VNTTSVLVLHLSDPAQVWRRMHRPPGLRLLRQRRRKMAGARPRLHPSRHAAPCRDRPRQSDPSALPPLRQMPERLMPGLVGQTHVPNASAKTKTSATERHVPASWAGTLEGQYDLRATVGAIHSDSVMRTKSFSLLPLALAFTLGALAPASAALAATKHAAKAAAPKKAAVSPIPALEAQTALAGTPPALHAKAWLLMDYDSGELLAAANIDEALPPASLTKMMTSYIIEQALRSGKLKETDMVGVSKNAWCRGSNTESCMYLPLNGQASVIDMLRGIIIQSGNDASKAMAEHMAGTEEGFAKLMNEEAQRLGMRNTHFVNPTGMPDPEHKSSAHDLAILARAIIRDSAQYYPLYAERDFTFNNIKQGNRNALLYTDSSVDGLKTGHTQAAGYCLVTSAKRNGMRLITVVLNTHSARARADETRSLLSWGFSTFSKATPIEPNTVVDKAKVSFGKVDTVPAGLGEAWTLTVPRGQKVQTKVELNANLEAPVAKGAVIGKVVASANGKTLGEAPLLAQAEVERAGLMKRLWQHLLRLF
jgi:D-alanyl-D-alanine carboxypeptidase (penicillin-binding protein 5/6)